MKKFKPTISLLLFLSLAWIACNKSSRGPEKPVLTLSKPVAKIGEPVVASSSGMTAGSSIVWSASPNATNWSSPGGDSATYLFTSPGIYQITATFLAAGSQTPYDSSYSTITVSDSLYNDSFEVHCTAVLQAPFKAGDQIILTPVDFSDSAGIVLLSNTRDTYGQYPYLAVDGNFSGQGGSFEYDFNGVTEYPCNGPGFPEPATGNVFFSSLTNGTHDLVMKFNGNTYHGSLLITDTDCSFTWNDQSGIVISPLHLQKR